MKYAEAKHWHGYTEKTKTLILIAKLLLDCHCKLSANPIRNAKIPDPTRMKNANARPTEYASQIDRRSILEPWHRPLESMPREEKW